MNIRVNTLYETLAPAFHGAAVSAQANFPMMSVTGWPVQSKLRCRTLNSLRWQKDSPSHFSILQGTSSVRSSKPMLSD